MSIALPRAARDLPTASVQNSICTPSRAAILTGQYSHKNGVYTLDDRLDPIGAESAFDDYFPRFVERGQAFREAGIGAKTKYTEI